MGTTWSGRLVSWTSTKVILLLHHLDHQNTCTTNLQHTHLAANQMSHAHGIFHQPHPGRNNRHNHGAVSPLGQLALGTTHGQPKQCTPTADGNPPWHHQVGSVTTGTLANHCASSEGAPGPAVATTPDEPLRVPPGPAVTTMPDEPLRVTIAAPPTMTTTPDIPPLPEHMPHMILDDHDMVPQTNDIVPRRRPRPPCWTTAM